MNISSSWVAESTLLLCWPRTKGGNYGRDSGGNAADFADGAQDGAFHGAPPRSERFLQTYTIKFQD